MHRAIQLLLITSSRRIELRGNLLIFPALGQEINSSHNQESESDDAAYYKT